MNVATAVAKRMNFTPANDSPVSQSTTTKGTQMTWILALLQLVPVIANGIHTLHADKSLGDKTAMAKDALNLAIQGAKAVAPANEQAIVDGVGSIAQDTLSTTVAALHNGTPAAAPTPAPAAAA